MKDHYVFFMKITTTASRIFSKGINLSIFTIKTFSFWPSNYADSLSQYPGGNCLTHRGNENY